MNSISYYEAVANASRDMLDAARRQDWDALVLAEQRCALLIAQMKSAGAEALLDDAGRQRKAQIIRGVLADDAEIRRLLDPRLHELEGLLSGAATRRRVDDAYRA